MKNTKRKYIVFVASEQVDNEITYNQAFELANKAHEIGFIDVNLDDGYILEPFKNLI